MTGRGLCSVEVVNDRPIRIFRSNKSAAIAGLHGAQVTVMARVDATRMIREDVFARTGAACEFCGAIITWGTMHLHERKPRGEGGEISLENSVGICAKCHEFGPNAEHADRRLRWG
jgi:hypothetical protein